MAKALYVALVVSFLLLCSHQVASACDAVVENHVGPGVETGGCAWCGYTTGILTWNSYTYTCFSNGYICDTACDEDGECFKDCLITYCNHCAHPNVTLYDAHTCYVCPEDDSWLLYPGKKYCIRFNFGGQS